MIWNNLIHKYVPTILRVLKLIGITIKITHEYNIIIKIV